jgi:hypothetical protein
LNGTDLLFRLYSIFLNLVVVGYLLFVNRPAVNHHGRRFKPRYAGGIVAEAEEMDGTCFEVPSFEYVPFLKVLARMGAHCVECHRGPTMKRDAASSVASIAA